MTAQAAILFEPDGYTLSGPKLMGRQAAGNAFLRAAVAHRDAVQPLMAYTPHQRSAQVFARMVRDIDPATTAGWIPADQIQKLEPVGTLYLPGPSLRDAARLRLRAGPSSYSLCGVTHTTASHTAMDAITELLSEPVMPWDALICTSTAVKLTVDELLAEQADYLRWRFGQDARLNLPELPVIPLGVHCDDFAMDEPARQAARQSLGIADDEVVMLFVGRLSFHAKAHPHAMYAALQSAAAQTGRKIVLLQCGWFANEAIETAFKSGAQAFCPSVRTLFTDGKDVDTRRRSWCASDVFVSLSDNIQETFGLTPIEAMAAGLPVVVSDWNGYKDTVRDGVDGFRIPTAMPAAGLGAGLARRHEAGVDSYDFYCGLACQWVSVDLGILTQRLVDLIAQPEWRRELGKAAQRRARDVFDWSVVYRQYQALWTALAARRRDALAAADGAPKAAPSRMDPLRAFAHYPTHSLTRRSIVKAMPNVSIETAQHLLEHGLFSYASRLMPAGTDTVKTLWPLLAVHRSPSVADIARLTGISEEQALSCVALLAKTGLILIDHAHPHPR